MSVFRGGDIEIPKGNFAEYIFSKLREHPEHILLIDGATNRGYSRKYILAQTYRYVKLLSGQGLVEGDVVGLCSENSVEMACIVYAALYLGLTLSTLNFLYSPAELRHMITLTTPKIVLCSPTVESVVVQVVASSDLATTPVVVIGSTKRSASTSTVQLFSDTADRPIPQSAQVDPFENVAGIFSSSGTTGLAKGVSITQGSFNFNVKVIGEMIFTVPESEVRLLTFLPWFHLMGFFILYYLPLVRIHMVFLSRFDPKLFLTSIQRHRITSTILVPPVVVFLAKDKAVDAFDLSSLREIYSGAAPLQAETEQAVYKRFPSIAIIRQGYGMTEGLTMTLPPKQAVKQGSVGRLVKGTEAKIIDTETGRLLGPNAAGELCFRGPHMMKSYFRNEEATRNSYDEDGFYHTGDVGYVDSDGFFFIVDRLKELIKYKGYQVPPAELEAILLSHPRVKDAAVIGIPDERSGELPLAFIVRQPGVEVTADELTAFVAGHTSPAKRLHGGVRFVEEIPKNPSGKILRRILREKVKGGGGKAKL